MSKKLINGLKYEKLTEEQLYDLSQWELVDIILAYREDLKAKEQECDGLRKVIDEAKNSKLDLNSFFAIEATVGEYCLELDQLKAENENWQKEYWKLEQGNDFWAEKNSRLRGCLTEIKEIAEHCIKQDICTTCDNSEKCHIEDKEIPTYDVCKLILQKISECEVEE